MSFEKLELVFQSIIKKRFDCHSNWSETSSIIPRFIYINYVRMLHSCYINKSAGIVEAEAYLLL